MELAFHSEALMEFKVAGVDYEHLPVSRTE